MMFFDFETNLKQVNKSILLKQQLTSVVLWKEKVFFSRKVVHCSFPELIVSRAVEGAAEITFCR